jgi:hypothetical protein
MLVDGGTGRWDGRTPTFLPYNLPPADPATGWTSGFNGESIIRQGKFQEAFDLAIASVPTTSACSSRCATTTGCVAWPYEQPTQKCAMKQQPKFFVEVGNQHAAPLGTFISSTYSAAGWADVAVLRLERPVPSSMAVPMAVVRNLGDSYAEVRSALNAKPLRIVGFTTGLIVGMSGSKLNPSSAPHVLVSGMLHVIRSTLP